MTMGLDEGLILPGVTRLSIMEMVRCWESISVVERTLTMEQFKRALCENRVSRLTVVRRSCWAAILA